MIRRTVLRGFLVAGVMLAGPAAQASEPAPVYREHLDLSYYLDAQGARHPVRSANDWGKRREHVLEHMQAVMGPLPGPANAVPLGVRVTEEEQVGDLVRKKLTYHSDSPEQVTSAYLFLPAMESGEKRAAVLCLHQTTFLGKSEPAGLGGNANLHYALELAQRGYVTLAPDYPFFGDSRGYDFADDDYASGTMKAIYDNIRAVDLLQSLPEVDPERVGAIGHSLGGHNAMFTAAFEPRIKALVSSCGFTRFHKYYSGALQPWAGQVYMPLVASHYGNDPDRMPFDFTEVVAAFAPRAFLAVAPMQDSNFEVSGVQDAIDAARRVYELFDAADHLQAVYPDAGHDFPADARRTAYEFLDRHLEHPTQPKVVHPQAQD